MVRTGLLNKLSLFGKTAPLFGIEGLVSGSDFPRIAKIRVAESRKVMKEWRLTKTENPAKDIETLDSVSNTLCGIADAAEFIRNVHSDPKWIQGATEAVEAVGGFMNEANVDSGLFDRAQSVLELGKKEGIDKEYMHVITAMVDAMKNEGVGLDPLSKEKLVSLQEQDMIKSFEITKSAPLETNTDFAWVDAKHVAQADMWSRMIPSQVMNGVTSLGVATGVLPHFLKYVTDRTLRQNLWEKSLRRPDSRKEEQMHELVKIRTEMAQLRGYKNWNHYAQRESVLSGPSAVDSFLTSLWTDLLPGLGRELQVLESLNMGKTVEAWDLEFLMNQWKSENEKQINGIKEIEKNLTFQKIIAGGQKILHRVLNIDLQFDPSGPLWHQDAFRLSLSRPGGVPFSYMYIDPYERSTKSVQSAQFTLAGSKVLPSGERQVPQTALVLALPRDPSSSVPLNVGITFFHELGHACHSLLSETKLQHFSGSRGAIDFVEFPSHLFEYFATEPETLDVILGGSVSQKHLEQYSKNRNPFGHLEIAQQLAYAMLDQVYYETGTPSMSLSSDQQILALLQPNSVASFDHLVHYGGSYYCYLLCRAMAAQVWDGAFRSDPWNAASGARLAEFLKQGSVDQSLDAIYRIDPSSKGSTVSTKFLIKDISKCPSIHS